MVIIEEPELLPLGALLWRYCDDDVAPHPRATIYLTTGASYAPFEATDPCLPPQVLFFLTNDLMSNPQHTHAREIVCVREIYIVRCNCTGRGGAGDEEANFHAVARDLEALLLRRAVGPHRQPLRHALSPHSVLRLLKRI